MAKLSSEHQFLLKLIMCDINLRCLVLYPCGEPILSLSKELISTNLPEFIKQIKDQLEIAHKNNIYHHDIRPHNIIVHEDKAILIDWGLSNTVIYLYIL